MFSVWLCMSAGVCLEALEVHLWNICQGSSVITSLKSRGEWDRSDENDLWRNIRGGDAIKRDAKSGNCGGRHRVEGKDQKSLGEDARKHSLLGLNPLTEPLAHVQCTYLPSSISWTHSNP